MSSSVGKSERTHDSLAAVTCRRHIGQFRFCPLLQKHRGRNETFKWWFTSPGGQNYWHEFRLDPSSYHLSMHFWQKLWAQGRIRSAFPSMQMQHSSSSVSSFTLNGHTKETKGMGFKLFPQVDANASSKDLILSQETLMSRNQRICRQQISFSGIKMHENCKIIPSAWPPSPTDGNSSREDKKSICCKIRCKIHHLRSLWEHLRTSTTDTCWEWTKFQMALLDFYWCDKWSWKHNKSNTQ